LIPTAISIGIGIPLSFGLFYFGLFGGADSKAMICLTLTLPLIPRFYAPLIGYLHPFFPIVVLVMSFVSSISVALWIGLRNLTMFFAEPTRMFEGLQNEQRWRKLFAFITGYSTSVSNLQSKFYLYPMEKVVEDEVGAHRSFQLFVGAETDRDELVSKLTSSLDKVGSPNTVWVTPGIPMLLFMLVGLILTLILGDPILTAIFSTLRR